MVNQPLFIWFEEKRVIVEHSFISNVIYDRWSKYSVSWGIVSWDKKVIKEWLWKYLTDKYFKKATHNTYAYRIYGEDGLLIEWKNDDWEIGAGKCILTILKRENIIDCIVVVTRYFGWIHLNADRFRHVIDATNIFIEKYVKKW